MKDTLMVVHYNSETGSWTSFYGKSDIDHEQFMFHPDCRIVEVTRNMLIVDPKII